MSYKLVLEADHIYVQYLGDVDPLDIIHVTSDPDFITPFRQLEAVIHDFSKANSVNIGLDEIREIAVLSKLESNFTEQLKGIIIPFDMNDTTRVEALKKAIETHKWDIHIVENLGAALALL